MDDQLRPTMPALKPASATLPHLPTYVSVGGSLVSIMVWYALLAEMATPFTLPLTAVPWLILVVGIMLSLLCGLSLRFNRLYRTHQRLLRQINYELSKKLRERAKDEEIKQKYEIAIMQGQKLQAMGTLAGGIAHDFNNILYAIKGYVDMTRDDVPAESTTYHNLGKVLTATKRGTELVARILEFGRRQQQREFKPIYVKAMLDNILDLLRPTVPASIMIQVADVDGTLAVLGNQTQLHQVLVNIINNAVDAMEQEGTIKIAAKRLLASDEFLKATLPNARGNYCQITVSDTGHGMDKTTMERIFEPFFTTKEVGKGTGLGLATAQAIAQEHQGIITVTSQLGQGTTFTILLPELHLTA